MSFTTEELDLSAVPAVQAYKELSEVERGFRELKDLIEMRPIYHQQPKPVRAHIFVAALAFLLIGPWRRNSKPPECRCPVPKPWKPCAPCTWLTSELVQRFDAE